MVYSYAILYTRSLASRNLTQISRLRLRVRRFTHFSKRSISLGIFNSEWKAEVSTFNGYESDDTSACSIFAQQCKSSPMPFYASSILTYVNHSVTNIQTTCLTILQIGKVRCISMRFHLKVGPENAASLLD